MEVFFCPFSQVLTDILFSVGAPKSLWILILLCDLVKRSLNLCFKDLLLHF